MEASITPGLCTGRNLANSPDLTPTTVFRDRLAYVFDDEDHSIEESREIIIGHSAAGRLLAVSFKKKTDKTVRIIRAA